MKSETLVQQLPPTPPNVASELQSGLQHIAHYNANRSYSFEEAHSHHSSYGSPKSSVHKVIPQHSTHSFHSSHSEGHSDPDFGLGIQYDGYGQGPVYYPDGHLNSMPNSQVIISGSPPTPRSASENDDSGRRTQSGRMIAPSSSPPQAAERRKSKPVAKTKKGKAGKSEKPKTPKLTAPLSILTKDMASIPVRNMKEWVNRSAEVRRKEVEKRNGYVTRPMNSFMLYRSAYAERTKQWCLQNNHQVVSSVSGESWPLEPPEVRELYNDYAKIERINHQNAHPTYKFSPSKAASPSRKRKGEYSDNDDLSEYDDADWAPGHGKQRARVSRRPERGFNLPSHSMSPDFFGDSFARGHNGMNKPAWNMPSEGRPMPIPMHNELYNHYYQPTYQPHFPNSVMEDMRMRRVDTPGLSMQFSPGHALLGLPGGNATDLMEQLNSNSGTPLGDESDVDPMLLAFDGSHHQDVDHGIGQYSEFRNGHVGMIDRELDQDSVHSILNTGTSHEDFASEQWHHDSTMAPMEHSSDLERWLEDHHT